MSVLLPDNGFPININQFLEAGVIPYIADYVAQCMKQQNTNTLILVDVDDFGASSMPQIEQSKEILGRIVGSELSIQILTKAGEHCLHI